VREKTEERFEMEVLVIVIHAVAALLLAGVILLQSGKGGGMGAGFGGASSAATNIFGGRGATGFLGQATVGLAATFMFTSLTLAYMSAKPQTQMDLTETDGATQAQEDEIVEAGAGAGVVAPAEKPAEIVPVELPSIPVEPTEVIEEPAVEVVPAEKPAVEKPAVEAPAVEAPAVEKPAVEAPAAE
jgi:preprotein translocase subunit SecG